MSNWWKKSIVYQIYPQSFQDSNDDGIGDIGGIRQRLDYLQRLGVDVLWLTPIYKSPLVDNGYDISDYYDINPQYGTLADFKSLLTETHDHGLKLIMDLVVNHTSDQHPWFQQSKASKNNEYSDYYIWRDPKDDGTAPSNWGAAFGGSAWTYVPERRQYYLHLFAPGQPDLNWENPELRQAVYKMMRFWLDMGVDGFRMDTISLLSKNMNFPDLEVSPGDKYASFYEGAANGPRVHEYLQEMYREVLSRYDIMTVGETPHTTMEQARLYTDPSRHELNMVFQTDHMHVDYGQYGKWSTLRYKLSDLRESMNYWQVGLGTGRGWNSLFWGNHDQPRAVSKFGDDQNYRVQSAKAIGLLLHFMQGTPYIYQGEEIGMTNVDFTLDQYRDLDALNGYDKLLSYGVSESQALAMLHHKSRDNARTPFQWNASENAGFSRHNPWIDVNPNYKLINADEAEKDQNSILAFYKQLTKLRHTVPAITDGTYQLERPNDSAVYSYTRSLGKVTLLVVVSCSNDQVRYQIPTRLSRVNGSTLITTYSKPPVKDGDMIYLRPYEGAVYVYNNA